MTRTITIIPVLNGFVCRVDCQSVVFTYKQTMLGVLSEYYDKPCEVEKRFRERATNMTFEAPPERVANSPIPAECRGTSA